MINKGNEEANDLEIISLVKVYAFMSQKSSLKAISVQHANIANV